MKIFTLQTDDGGVVSGRLSFPAKRITNDYVPLVICLHGGSYDSEYFDAGDGYSIASVTDALQIPVIAVNRAGYEGTKPCMPDGEPDTYAEAQGKYLDSTVIPALWKEYGPHVRASSVVILAHSIGAMMAIISVGCHQQAQSYPLSGLIVSGIGSEHVKQSRDFILQLLSAKPEHLNFDPSGKDTLMLCLPNKNLTNFGVADLTARLNKPLPYGEVYDINVSWLQYWRKYAGMVKVPVMHCIGEFDGLWVASDEAIGKCQEAFRSSPRVETFRLPLAPHCIELSRQHRGWLARCCGFAMECAVQDGLKRDVALPE